MSGIEELTAVSEILEGVGFERLDKIIGLLEGSPRPGLSTAVNILLGEINSFFDKILLTHKLIITLGGQDRDSIVKDKFDKLSEEVIEKMKAWNIREESDEGIVPRDWARRV